MEQVELREAFKKVLIERWRRYKYLRYGIAAMGIAMLTSLIPHRGTAPVLTLIALAFTLVFVLIGVVDAFGYITGHPPTLRKKKPVGLISEDWFVEPSKVASRRRRKVNR